MLMTRMGRRRPRRSCRWPAVAGFLLLASPVIAATQDAPSQASPVLFGLALLVVGAKIGGLAAERWGQPSVLGELVIGIAAGNFLPPFFGEHGIAFVRSNPTLHVLAEIGVLVLLFDVGLEVDLRALVRVGLSATLVALIGVATPFALGWGTARWLMPDTPPLAHLFVGATLTATSVGITVRVLKDLRSLQSREGQVILGAAILDDILGLVVLAVMTGLVTATAPGGAGLSEVAFTGIVLKSVTFLAMTIALGHYLSGPIQRLAARMSQPDILLVVGLAICFALAFLAERIGLAGIVGAFAAGLLLDPYGEGVRTADEATLSKLLSPISSVFVPLFFVLMGIQVDLMSFITMESVAFGGVLTLAAIVGKLATAAGVVGRDINRLAVGIGMVPRGEVGLIFAGIGAALTVNGQPLLSQAMFSALVVMIVVTTLLAPIGLRIAMPRAGRTP
jgi:Kef-type K+ transport system membrane component KefB